MTHRHTLLAATWIFSRLVPEADREQVIGDLAEEYAMRAQTNSSSVALTWYLSQICASTLPVMRIRLARAVWLATLGVALLAYLAVGVVQLIIGWALPTSYGPTYDPLGLFVVFPVIVLVGCFAERSRRKAAIVLAAMMLLAITALTMLTTENAPLWYYAAYFLVGPVGALVGGALGRVSYQRSQK